MERLRSRPEIRGRTQWKLVKHGTYGLTLILFLLFNTSLLAQTITAAASQKKPPPSGSKITAIVTDKTSLNLPSTFGDVGTIRVNQSGDAVFTGSSGIALFLRRFNYSSTTRLLQMGDAMPGVKNAQVVWVGNPFINDSGTIAFVAGYSTYPTKYSIYTYDGRSFRKVVSDWDPLPNGGTVGSVSPIGFNNAGEIAFLGDPTNYFTSSENASLYLATASGIVRLAGHGDYVASAGTIDQLTSFRFNNAGDVLFQARINGRDDTWGVFVANRSGVVRTCTKLGYPTQVYLNDSGAVAFVDDVGVWVSYANSTLQQIAGNGWPAPIIPGHDQEIYTGFDLRAFNATGHMAVWASLSPPNPNPNPTPDPNPVPNALFRFTGPGAAEVVAFPGEVLPDLPPGNSLNNIPTATVSMNKYGAISFRPNISGTIQRALFKWTPGPPAAGTLTKVAAETETVPLISGGTYGLVRNSATITLDNGNVEFLADVIDGVAYSGVFLYTGLTTKAITSSADTLPSGARIGVRTAYPSIAGNYVAFRAFRAGGRESLWVYNLATAALTRIAVDGDFIPESVSKIRISPNNRFMNANGQVFFLARAVGGAAYGGNAILMGTPAGPLKKIVAQMDPYDGGTIGGISLNNILPNAVNNAGKVVFTANAPPNGPGIFVGSPDALPVKLAMRWDPAPDTIGYFQNFTSVTSRPQINAIGQVAFQALIAPQIGTGWAWRGYFVGMPGGRVDKIVMTGDLSAMGNPFNDAYWWGFGFNNLGEVAFISTLDGWPKGGVFVGHPQLITPATVVMDDAWSPGGDYALSAPLNPMADVNDFGDVVFRSDLTGGPATAGLFLRRLGDENIIPVMVEGQAVPGENLKFLPPLPILYGYNNESLMFTPAGDVLFEGQFMQGTVLRYGLFRFATNNTLTKVFTIGDSVPQGGILSDIFPLLSASDSGQAAFWGTVAGGKFLEAIFVAK